MAGEQQLVDILFFFKARNVNSMVGYAQVSFAVEYEMDQNEARMKTDVSIVIIPKSRYFTINEGS